ncbi:MAG: hypothetical protein ACK2U5_05120, partial [Candidatus Promineifilaceae bacterium]
MKRWKLLLMVAVLTMTLVGLTGLVFAAVSADELLNICNPLYPPVFGVPNGEPLGPCQWDMAIINASDDGSYGVATGAGVKVGVIDGGGDFTHPDVAPNLNVDLSCS